MIVAAAAGANIAAGRNAAIRRAAGPIVAVTDAGCIPGPEWLAALVAGFATPGTDVVMGFYRPDPRSGFERFLAYVNLPGVDEIDPAKFMPSSRSVAFHKAAWEKAGGYPEWLAIGEDMYFNFRLLDAGAQRVFAPTAIVRWRLRPNLRSCLKQYYRYARGDGIAGMYPRRHLMRFATYTGGLALAALAVTRPVLFIALAAAVVMRMIPAYRRLPRRDFLLGLVALPLLEVALDAAKMAGYLAGLTRRGDRDRG